jgi:hypothetical protein
MTNPYLAITTYNGDFWEGHLKELCLYDIFADLINKYTDQEILGKILRYIAWQYSEDSDKVVLNMALLQNKQSLFKLAGLPKELYDPIVLFSDEIILQSIIKWLDFQDNDVFTQLMVFKQLKLEMQLSANSPLKNSSGQIDYDQKFKNANYAMDLRKKINDLEKELIQNSPTLSQFVKEVKTVVKKKTTTGVEEFVKR